MKVQQTPPSHLANMQHQPQQQQRILNSQMQMVLNQNYNSSRTGKYNLSMD